MRLKYKFEYTELGDEMMAVPMDEDSFFGLLRVNKTAKLILDKLSEDTTLDDITAYLVSLYPSDSAEEIRSYVEEYTAELRDRDLLTENT